MDAKDIMTFDSISGYIEYLMDQVETEDSDDEDIMSIEINVNDEELQVITTSGTPDDFTNNETEDSKGEVF